MAALDILASEVVFPLTADQRESGDAICFRREHGRGRDTVLGLAIAHQLAQAIGGSLKLHNREGGGLVAEVRIGATSS